MAGMSGATPESPDQIPDRQADLSALIAGAIAERHLQQLAITRRPPAARRCQEGLSMIRLAEQVGAYRLRKRRPELSETEALPIIRGAPKDDMTYG
jgi:hypothetical protein